MDYKLFESRFIDYLRKTEPKVRLQSRNPLDERLIDSKLYIEIHHIIPKSLGGTDDSYNLVAVLPEEHLFLHKLRWKIYKCREDALALRFMLNGIVHNARYKNHNGPRLTKAVKNGYSFIRTNSATIRKLHGWHTPEGAARIAAARRNTFPAVDKDGNSVGSVDVNHPKVIAGEWVHHSKGKSLSSDHKEKLREYSTGLTNGNSNGHTNEELIECFVDLCIELGYIPDRKTATAILLHRGIKFPKSFREFRFGGKYSNFIKQIEQITNMKYRRTLNGN
jgi:hypothetical protein